MKIVLVLMFAATTLPVWNFTQDLEDEVDKLIIELADANKSSSAADKLVKIGDDAVTPLCKAASSKGKDLFVRGWAIACLGEIKSTRAVKPLITIMKDVKEKDLIRTFAVKALLEISSEKGFNEVMFSLASWNMQGDLQQEIVKQIMDKSENIDRLFKIWIHHSDDNIRRFAAGMLGGKGDEAQVRTRIIKELVYTQDKAKSSGIPWKGAALWIPSINWTTDELVQISINLVNWWFYCEAKKDNHTINQLRNNLWNFQSLLSLQINNGGAKEWAKALMSLGKGKIGAYILECPKKFDLLQVIINSLKKNNTARDDIVDKLKELTGEKLGDNTFAWKYWLKQQRDALKNEKK